MYAQNPTWKCVLERPEQPPVAIDLHWVGREKELAQLEEWALNNISYHLRKEPQFLICLHPFLHVPKDIGTFALLALS